MGNIVITGATSFIGLNLINKLLETDNNIFAIDHYDSKNIKKLPQSKRIKVIDMDMNDTISLDNQIKEQCDIFIHLAWAGTRGKGREDQELQENNYRCSLAAINVAHKLGCKTFLGAGSQAEYGSYTGEINEESICNPNTEYGKAKLKVCHEGYDLCKKYKMSFKWIRFFSLYGLEDAENTLIISTIDKMLLNEPINLTECIQMWNFLHIKDAINGITILLAKDNQEGIYNIGNNDTRALKLFVTEISGIIQSKSNLNFGAVPYPQTGIVSIQPNIDKIVKETGWQPKVSFEKGIKGIILKRKEKLGVK